MSKEQLIEVVTAQEAELQAREDAKAAAAMQV